MLVQYLDQKRGSLGRQARWQTPKVLPHGEAKLPAALLLNLEDEGLAHFCQSEKNGLVKHRKEADRKTLLEVFIN